jgi:Mce-associated membrane protein
VPPHRRRPAPSPGQAPPIRRPKVAGIRNRPEPADVRAEESPESPERVSGVLNGLRGTPPKRGSDEETAVLPRITDVPPDDEQVEVDPETNEPPAVVEEDTADTAGEEDTADTADLAGQPVSRPRPRPRETARPAGKRRSAGTARPDDLAVAESDTERRPSRRSSQEKVETRPARSRAQTQISMAIALTVVAVILGVLAFVFRGNAAQASDGDTNTALTDSATTSQIRGQLTNAIKQTFSYNYTDLGSTEKAVKENLTGKALCEYNLLFGEVKQLAPQQKIVLDTTVRELAVVRIDGDRAEALVYIDQLSTRVDVNKTVAVGGQFAVRAKKVGDHWKITEFDMFGQPLFNGKPAPTC